MWVQSVLHSRAGRGNEFRIKGIDVKTNMNRFVQIPDKVDGLADGQMADVVLLDDLCLPVVDVANADIGEVFEWKVPQTHSAGPVLAFKSRADGKRCAVSVATFSGIVSVNVGVSVDPDNMQVSVLLVRGHD